MRDGRRVNPCGEPGQGVAMPPGRRAEPWLSRNAVRLKCPHREGVSHTRHAMTGSWPYCDQRFAIRWKPMSLVFCIAS
ncbi:hypothetical protein E3G49_001772 [Mycobacteroides abscessus]|nr:hypothetical protein [Mycobacteroides abscessus]